MRKLHAYSSVLLLFVGVSFSTGEEEWLHCTVLDSAGKFHVCWSTRLSGDGSQEIEFLVEVEAHGYIGIGLSPNGGMAGSDIVTGWIKDGNIYFQDRHGKGNFLPEIDARGDWNLISGSENDSHTSFTFRRKLDTCDTDDMKIDDSTMRLIYAYSDEDPSSEDDIQYHSSRRGTKSVMLLQQRRKNQHKIDKSTLYHWDVLSPNFTLQSTFSTMYWCKIYKSPELSEKNHIVLVEPLIQEGNEAYVHHLLLYECVGGDPEDYDPHVDLEGHQCHRPNMPDVMKKCEGVFLAWGVGGANLIFPENVGLPLVSSPSKYYMMEIHYDNPSRKEGIVDRSGFRIYYTPKLRKFDAGTLMIGSTVSSRVIVPPKLKEYVVSGHSNPACLDPAFPEDGVKVIGVFLHAHLLGRRLKARHYRNKTELRPLAEDNNYDFNYQEYRYNVEETDLLRGDQVTVECTYDSSERQVATFGGESTREEMCLAFLLYYPRIERFASLSVPKLDVINTALQTNFTKYDMSNGILRKEVLTFDWTTVNVDEVERELRNGLHDTHCYFGDGDKSSIKSSINYPEIRHPFTKMSSCVHKEFRREENNGNQKNMSESCLLFVLLFIVLCTL